MSAGTKVLVLCININKALITLLLPDAHYNKCDIVSGFIGLEPLDNRLTHSASHFLFKKKIIFILFFCI